MASKKVARRERRVKKRAERKEHVQKQRKHYKTRQRNKKVLNTAIVCVIVVLVGYGLFLLLKPAPDGQHDALAKCLTEQGVIMYGTDWCQHCQNQKRAFGSSFKFVNYINCDLHQEACTLAGVQGYPTWTFGESSFSGAQDLDFLAERSGCSQ